MPREYWTDLNGRYGHVRANNSKVLVVHYSDSRNPGFHRTLAYDKANKTWSQVPLPGYPLIRAFGATLAMSELVKLGPEAKSARAAKPNRREGVRRNGFSQGVTFRFEEELGTVYPGRLHIYDVATKKRSTIVTNEEDSEVLLVDDDTIYYRVNDSLYSTPIGSSGFMPGQKIATDDRILDVHWAFMK